MIFARIRDLREDKDLTQAEVAKQINITREAYAKYETGIRDIPLTVLIRLADFYNTSVDYILEQTNNPERYKE